VRIVRTVVVDCHPDDALRHLARDGAHPEGPGLGPRTDVAVQPPAAVSWREADAVITYALEAVWTSTRLTRTEVRPDGPRALRRLRAARRGARAVRRLRAVRIALERGAPR
jgi:hypothetical protein